ncbi:MAG: exosortase [Pseudomonadota bacterium]
MPPVGASRWPARPAFPTAILWLGAALLAVPTLYDIATGPWSLDEGSYGVIVLAIALWLIARRWPAMRAAGKPGVQWLGWALFAAALTVHILARVVARIPTEAAALYVAGLAALYLQFGWPGLRQAAFPLAYLALAIPLSPELVALGTGPLRLAITHLVVELLGNAGLMIASEGLTLYVDQYEIAVAEACSGINSLISLTAIGLFYVHARGRRLGALSLPLVLAAILACAVIGNFARVLIIVLLTHFFGEAVAQGPLHDAAGLSTFVVALGAVMALDATVLRRLLPSGDFND